MIDLLGKSLAIVTAHPDDEAFLAGGLIALNRKQGGKTAIFCATLGEKGMAYVEGLSEDELKSIRREELTEAATKAGANKIYCGDLPDGGVEGCKEDLLLQVKEFLLEDIPDVVISFGPDGITGHLDHIAVGEVALQIAAEMSLPFVQFSRPPREVDRDFYEKLRKKRKFGRYADVVQKEEPNITLEIAEDLKRGVLECYKSQLPGLLRDDPSLTREYFLSR